MTGKQKTIFVMLWSLMVLSLLAMVAVGMRSRMLKRAALEEAAERPLQPLYPTPSFALVDQDGKPFTDQSVRGGVWIADFIFTRCPGPCPLMTSRMAQVQKELAGTPIKLVSFSIDPEYDTPPILKAYAGKYGADEIRWTFATGATADIHAIAKAMNIGITPATQTTPLLHSTHFVLIGADGKIYGYYSGQDDDGWKRLVADARTLHQRAR